MKASKPILYWIVAALSIVNLKAQNNNNNYKFSDTSLEFNERADNLIETLTIEEKVSQLKYNADAIPRLNIHEYNWWNEALHGLARAGKATVFPQAIGIAATFDENLAEEIASAIADEARAKYYASINQGIRLQYTGLTFWTPNVNIFRDPRWGRGQETYGEDPLLTSKIGVAFVNGLQGNHPKFLKTAACAKHYAVHSGPEALRHEFDAITSKKDLFETYLPAFEALVKSDVEAVMCAYNRYNSEPCCANTYLMNILKNQWGFKGHVLSDCWALVDFHGGHQYTSNVKESAALAANSGISLNCGSTYNDGLIKAINEGLVSEETINELLRPLIITKLKLGLFDKPEDNPFYTSNTDIINGVKHQELAYEAATKSIVLLKNNGVLPLSKTIPFLYVVGPNASSSDALIGNYYGTSSQLVTVVEGLTEKISIGSKLQYSHGFLLHQENINPIDWASGIANEADATIVVMGLNGILEGEEGDALASEAKGDMFDLSLPANQITFLKKMRDQTKKPLIVVLTGGSPVIINEIHEIADAVLWAWYPGEQGGNAVADIIFGTISPSGKLPVTFVKSVNDLPPYEDYNMEGRTYRYSNKEPQYPFGFGLTYSQFALSDLKTNKKEITVNDTLIVEVIVKNTGEYKTEDVIQLYITHENVDFRVPLTELKDFQRVNLDVKEEKLVEFKITPDMLNIIDMEGNAVWVPSDIKISVASACPIQRSIDLGAPTPVSSRIRIR